jgi:co-chaperonin GroES (HSP10)
MQLQGNFALILPDEEHTMTKGGIYIPETSRKKRNTGMVVLLGEEADPKFDKRRVLYNKLVETDMEFEGLSVALVFCEDIIAILD